MSKKAGIPRIETGVRNLDPLFGGGLPKGSTILISGPPGSGKTILTQQMCFHVASEKQPALYFNTLSEPTAKTLRYLNQFAFFDEKKLDTAIRFVDLGVILRAKGLEQGTQLVMDHVKATKPSTVVIDSFKVFDDLAHSKEELRKFSYELVVKLMAWECTTFLLGEYGVQDYETNPVFSIIDGLVTVTQRELSGEQQRFIQIHKLRGTDHNRDEHPFVIRSTGIEVFAPRVTIRRESVADTGEIGSGRLETGIEKLDLLLGEGIPSGSTLLIAGVAGTGKTVLLLEFVYRGALAGEKGIIFSFEETEERLRATARGLGWDLDKEIERGMAEIVFIPQPEIQVEAHLLMMRERIEKLGARRVAVDSASVFLHKIKDPQIVREKVFQLASIVQNNQSVGFFATDIPYGSGAISRFGVEETVVDGVILLTSTEEGLERQRYLEVYKLRNTAHLKGRHSMVIGQGGIRIFPRYRADDQPEMPPPAIETSKRLSTGVSGLDDLLGGGLLQRSVTLASGSAGIGKSTLGVHFLLAGVKSREPGLYVTLEEGPEQILRSAEALGLPLRQAVEEGIVEIVFMPRQQLRPSELVATVLDKIRALEARRFVLDSMDQIGPEGSSDPSELRRLLDNLVGQLKRFGVTSVFTVESRSVYSTDTVTDQGFSPVADNLLMLRYRNNEGELEHTLSVVKTRGTAHDRRTHRFTIGKGGIQIGGGSKTGSRSSGKRRGGKAR
ncbi:MAG TPA: ATPase domain-containing protein [Planctomycetota bacterium]|nr:ATPase domain-containing protein [Planctomycetota bacterium]